MALPPMLDVLLLRALRSGPDFGHHLVARFEALDSELRPGPSTSFTSSTFGVLPNSQQNFPRLVQLAAKLFF